VCHTCQSAYVCSCHVNPYFFLSYFDFICCDEKSSSIALFTFSLFVYLGCFLIMWFIFFVVQFSAMWSIYYVVNLQFFHLSGSISSFIFNFYYVICECVLFATSVLCNSSFNMVISLRGYWEAYPVFFCFMNMEAAL